MILTWSRRLTSVGRSWWVSRRSERSSSKLLDGMVSCEGVQQIAKINLYSSQMGHSNAQGFICTLCKLMYGVDGLVYLSFKVIDWYAMLTLVARISCPSWDRVFCFDSSLAVLT